MKMYEVVLSQEEIDAIWLLSQKVNGNGKYKDCLIELGRKLKPFVSERILKTPLDRQVEGYITFTGNII